MEMIINIPDNLYKEIIETGVTKVSPEIFQMIFFGKKLNECHGRIIDESAITTVYTHTEECMYGNLKTCSTVIDYTDAPTILDAVK